MMWKNFVLQKSVTDANHKKVCKLMKPFKIT